MTVRRTMRARTISVFIAVAAMSVVPAARCMAQASELKAGTRLRVRLYPNRTVIGGFVSVHDRELLLGNPLGRVDRYPFDQIREVDASVGSSRHPLRGAAAGAVVGGVVGLFAGPRDWPNRPDASRCQLNEQHIATCDESWAYRHLSASGALYGALIGAGAGVVAGALIPFDDWSPIDLEPRSRVGGIAPIVSATAVGVSIRFR